VSRKSSVVIGHTAAPYSFKGEGGASGRKEIEREREHNDSENEAVRWELARVGEVTCNGADE